MPFARGDVFRRWTTFGDCVSRVLPLDSGQPARFQVGLGLRDACQEGGELDATEVRAFGARGHDPHHGAVADLAAVVAVGRVE
jgi:hypothetical protein